MRISLTQARSSYMDHQARAGAAAAPVAVEIRKVTPAGAHAALVADRLASLLAGRAPFDDAYRHILATPGKRLRADLTLTCSTVLSTLDCATPPCDEALDVACAIEMLHEASLVHDDICDGSVTRRGAPSIAAAFGVRFAAFAGLHLAALALDLLADVMDRVPDACGASMPDSGSYLVRLSELALGQLLEGLPPPATDQTALRRHYQTVAVAKTGTLFRIACLAGGVLAGCGGSQLAALTRYADHLGFAFQVMDDVHDLADTGRPAGTDVRRGVPSWPVIEWLAIREDATAHWPDPGRRPPPTVSPSTICAAVVDSGAAELARRTATREANAARSALHVFADTASRRHLADLCTWIAVS